jgi:hypothetical protein
MQSRQRQSSNQQSNVPPVPLTLWQRLPASGQQQLAHVVAELIQRVRTTAQDKERDHER